MNDFITKVINANKRMGKEQKIGLSIVLILLLMFFMKNLINNPLLLISIPVLLISVVFHEVAHGYVAYLMGDNTAKLMGRLSLNPIKHLDLFGMIVPAVLILFGSPVAIGWAKPVPINPNRFKKRDKGIFLVSIAGVTANLILVFLAATIIKINPRILENSIMLSILIGMIRINIVLIAFNLLPIPPLDGSKILWLFLSFKARIKFNQIERYGFFIIIILAFTGILGYLLAPITGFLSELVINYIS